MNELDRKLYELLADKTFAFGCKMHFDGSDCVYLGKDGEGCHMLRAGFVHSEGYETYLNLISEDFKIIGHEPTIADLHRWINTKLGTRSFEQNNNTLAIFNHGGNWIDYDSSLPLLQQSDDTKQEIINLIESCNKQ